ncbi:hypothetical protein BGZ98_004262 [Dissophora globulifera]|nr:hypothetical protein BGZ98_004262 [Dissophora globulifera]
MAKRDLDKSQKQSIRNDGDTATGASLPGSASTVLASDAASQFSKETVSDRKKKGWTKSLKKATNSILYMAMPPTSADRMPMVVAQTPMSPDRLVPALHSSILQASTFVALPNLSAVTSTTSSNTVAATVTNDYVLPARGPLTSSTSPSMLDRSVGSNSGYTGPGASSYATSSHPKPPNEAEKPLPSPPLSPPDIRRKQLTGDKRVDRDRQYNLSSVEQSLVAAQQFTPTVSQSANKASADSTGEDFNSEVLTSIPPNLSRFSFEVDAGQGQGIGQLESTDSRTVFPPKTAKGKTNALIKTRQDIVLEPFEETDADAELRELDDEPLSTGEQTFRTSPPGSSSSKKAKEQTLAIQETEVRKVEAVDLLPGSLTVKTSESVASPPSRPPPVPSRAIATLQAPPVSPTKTAMVTVTDRQPRDTRATTIGPTAVIEIFSKEPKVEIAQQIAPLGQKPTTDSVGFSAIPSRGLPVAHNHPKTPSGPRPLKNAPWIWHQDGIHHQRLESHQILTKEQVFEQFHMDLEQDGPNGFFLFKLVKRFRRQDPSQSVHSSSLLGAEISASPVSSPSSPASILDSFEAVSASQTLKRQLLLQKRKKQQGDDGNLEDLIAMSNNNGSLQNLNSSLQEVVDAVESLKDSEEWMGLLNHSRRQTVSQSQPKKPHYPDSEGEYTSRDKDALDVDTLERTRGVYSTGRLDGMNIVSKKRYKIGQKRASVSMASKKASTASASTQGSNGNEYGYPDGVRNDRRNSDTVDGLSSQTFKKRAVSQLHIYSRNGLKFKFDVMEDNELHFVEASKKYTFMDPLAPRHQPELDVSGGDSISSSGKSSVPRSPSNRNPSSGNASTTSDSVRSRRGANPKGKSAVSSTGSTGGRRVFVTRLGRHTLLTYNEYKTLAKSASSFTLGAKLLIQRSIAVATPSFYSSSSGVGGSNGHSRDTSQAVSVYDPTMAASPTKASFSSPVGSTPTPGSTSDSSDYINAKKKSRSITGFASKAAAAIKSPTTPTGAGQSKTSRPIVTPYNPNDYKNKSLTVAVAAPAPTATTSEESTLTPSAANTPLYTPQTERGGLGFPSSTAVETPGSESPSPSPQFPSFQSDIVSPSSLPSPTTVASPETLPAMSPVSTPSGSSSTSNTYGSIKRHGNQAGLKFQHLFVTVHQRLQKLELDDGSSFYGSALVQWTVIDDPAELRWWRDKIGIQMIGRLEGDEVTSTVAKSVPDKISQHPQQSSFSSAVSVRSSYVTAASILSDASSSSSSTSSPSSAGSFKSHVSVERLGYRFLRVSGHMGTLKVTVSEQVEARAVALAVRTELLRQKRVAQQQQDQHGQLSEDIQEQPWVELTESPVVSDEDDSCGDDTDKNDGYLQGGIRPSGHGASFNSIYEDDEWSERAEMKKTHGLDRFSRRKRHHFAARKQKEQQPLIERMTMIVGQARVFKGDWYMKNVYKFNP